MERLDIKGPLLDFYDSLLSRFNLKQTGVNVIGLTIGQSSVKIVELRRSNQGKQFDLVNYASHPLAEGTLIDDEIQNETDLINAIKEALEEGSFSTINVAIGLFGQSSISKRLKLAGGTAEEVEDQVYWESQQYIPFNLEEAYISYHVVTDHGDDGIDVLVAAATKESVDGLRNIIEKTGLKIKVVDIEQIAIVNVFEFIFADELKDSSHTHVIINMAGQKTDFIVYTDNSVAFAREIPLGGVSITEEIQRQMGVKYTEAEDLKTNRDENGNLPEEVVEIIDGVLNKLFEDIEETINFYKTSIVDENFETCYVTGGSSQIPGILERLKQILDIDIIQIDPFQHIGYDESEYPEELINQMSFTCVPAIGLAMRQC